MEELRKRQIPTLIHYPVPPHRQVCYEAYGDLSLPITERLAQEVLSLPISPVMTEGEVLVVSRAINDFYK
jgi:dTDP-4-amino-4,6-dideoxygalactose transaminase